MVQPRAKPHLLEARARVRRGFVAAVLGDQRGHEHVLEQGALRQETVILKDEADAAVPEVGEGRRTKAERVLPDRRSAVQRKLLDAAHNIFRAADGPRGPNAARALCEERLHD